jgi:Terpene synthase family 2, C-terminal metal binding
VTPAHLAQDCGRICATGIAAQRQLERCANSYPGLFPPRPYDGALFAALSQSIAFAAPWAAAEDLWAFNAMSLWLFALDLEVDTVSTAPPRARAVAAGCLEVAGGAQPPEDDMLLRFLADIRGHLSGRPGYPALAGDWFEALRAGLAGMLRECEWKAAGAPPSLDDYLDNAPSLNYLTAFTTHWVATGAAVPQRVAEVRRAARQVERVIRLANDLRSVGRDLSWGAGDLNALLLGPSRDEVIRRMRAEAGHARALLAPLDSLPEAVTLRRQMDFEIGFYSRSDYWGDLPTAAPPPG